MLPFNKGHLENVHYSYARLGMFLGKWENVGWTFSLELKNGTKISDSLLKLVVKTQTLHKFHVKIQTLFSLEDCETLNTFQKFES